jgi:hypothetical protein
MTLFFVQPRATQRTDEAPNSGISQCDVWLTSSEFLRHFVSTTGLTIQLTSLGEPNLSVLTWPGIQSICIPSTIEVISPHCFYGCWTLSVVVFEAVSRVSKFESDSRLSDLELDQRELLLQSELKGSTDHFPESETPYNLHRPLLYRISSRNQPKFLAMHGCIRHTRVRYLHRRRRRVSRRSFSQI